MRHPSSSRRSPPEVEDVSESLQPVIIAESRTTIPTLSVGEAVLQMEIGEEPLLMFRDERTNEISVVYRRDDGNVGWIDPSATQSAAKTDARA